MNRRTAVRHEFVDYIPEKLDDGVLYVGVRYATAAHLCCCECGNEVTTPLSPAQWSLTFDGQTTSLAPSIGNWSFACQSHYWIERNRVVSAPTWTKRRIAAGRAADRAAVDGVIAGAPPTDMEQDRSPDAVSPLERLWARIRKWLRR